MNLKQQNKKMKKTTVLLSKRNKELYNEQLDILNTICREYKNCPITLNRIDEYEMGNVALKELVKRLVADSEIIVIDFSSVIENDIRLRFIREIKTVKNLIPEVVACMKSGFATESENSKKMMSDALCPILQPANIVLYNDTQDFGRKLSSIFKGEFNFKELEGALV